MQIQQFEQRMMTGLGASQHREELHMELKQHRRQHEDAQFRALRSQLQVRELQENDAFNRQQYTEYVVRLEEGAKRFQSQYERALAEQQMTRISEVDLHRAEGRMLAETVQLRQIQELLEQQHAILQHEMMTMQEWGHQEVQAYQQLLRSSAHRNIEDHQEQPEPASHDVVEARGFLQFSVEVTPYVFGERMPSGMTPWFSVGARPSEIGSTGARPLDTNQG
jgi:hypothetical protein